MKDFTKAQARQWVAQELAKHNDEASIKARIATEQQTAGRLAKHGITLPNCNAASKALIVALAAKLHGIANPE